MSELEEGYHWQYGCKESRGCTCSPWQVKDGTEDERPPDAIRAGGFVPSTSPPAEWGEDARKLWGKEKKT